MKPSLCRWIPCGVLLALAVSGCATKPAPETADAAAVPARPASVATEGWVRTELYFSIGEWTETALNTDAEMRWVKFLDAEVTPRFPAGLSVIDIYGQWRDAKPGAALSRERSRLLVIVHPGTAEASAKIDELREAWKRATGEKSVLRVSLPAQVGF